MFCYKCGCQLPDNAQFCTGCGASQTAQPAQQNYACANNVPVQQPLPMKWHKFLIYFSLFLSAVVNAAQAFGYITGKVYEYMNSDVTVKMVYDFWGSELKVLDTVYGFFAIFMAILAIVTRFSLAAYKKDGVTLLHILYGMGVFVTIAYYIIAAAVVGVELDASAFSGIAVQLAVFSANITYYKKRSHLFR